MKELVQKEVSYVVQGKNKKHQFNGIQYRYIWPQMGLQLAETWVDPLGLCAASVLSFWYRRCWQAGTWQRRCCFLFFLFTSYKCSTIKNRKQHAFQYIPYCKAALLHRRNNLLNKKTSLLFRPCLILDFEFPATYKVVTSILKTSLKNTIHSLRGLS